MRDTVLSSLEKNRLIAILRGVVPERCLPLALALQQGGIRLLEITFDPARPESHAATARSIETLRTRLEPVMLVGAGTVLSPETAVLAKEAGAAFILSPNMDPRVIDKTRELGLVSIPGAMTPTEIAAAFEAGGDVVKVFPASSLGPGYFKALGGPLPHIPLLAVGGVDENNLAAYLAAGAVGAGIGGKLVDRGLVAEGSFSAITALARRYTAALAAAQFTFD